MAEQVVKFFEWLAWTGERLTHPFEQVNQTTERVVKFFERLAWTGEQLTHPFEQVNRTTVKLS